MLVHALAFYCNRYYYIKCCVKRIFSDIRIPYDLQRIRHSDARLWMVSTTSYAGTSLSYQQSPLVLHILGQLFSTFSLKEPNPDLRFSYRAAQKILTQSNWHILLYCRTNLLLKILEVSLKDYWEPQKDCLEALVENHWFRPTEVSLLFHGLAHLNQWSPLLGKSFLWKNKHLVAL